MATQLKKTVKPSGGDYTSLEACMNANEQNLVTADKYFDVEIDGTWSSADTTAVTIHNYTTDATRYINIYTTTAARHLGVWSTSYYILNVNGNFDIYLLSSFCYITGLQMTMSGGNRYAAIQVEGANSCKLISSIIANFTASRGGLRNYNGNPFTVINCIIYNIAGEEGFQQDSGVSYFYNTTIYNSAKHNFGNLGGSMYCFNCIGVTPGAGSLDFNAEHATSDYNLASDTSIGNTHDLTSKTATNQFVSIVGGSENLHLKLGADAIDVGNNYSAQGYTDDIDGVTRSGTWDIGADEFVAGGAANEPLKFIMVN